MANVFKQPLSIIELIKKSFTYYRLGWSQLMPLTLLFSFILTSPEFFISGLNSTNLQIFLDTMQQYAIYFPGIILITLFFYEILLLRLNAIMESYKESFGRTLLRALKKFPLIIIATIALLIMLGVGYVCFVIPGFYLLFLFAFYFPLLLLDDRGLVTAFTESNDIVTGHWWRTTILILLSFVIFVGLVFVIDTIGRDILVFMSSTNEEIHVFHIVLQIILSTLFLPWGLSWYLCQMRDLQVRHKLRKANATITAATA